MKMSIKEFIRSRKEKRKQRKAQKAVERKLNHGAQPMEFDPGEINPPETRFTPEYQAFLEAQQAREEAAAREAEAFPEAERNAETAEEPKNESAD